MSFSLPGLLLTLAILLPNLLMLLLPPRDMPERVPDAGIFITVLERIGQAGCFVLPALLGGSFNGRPMDLWLALSALCVVAYWAMWARYAIGGRRFRLLFQPLWFVPVPMALFPVLAFGFAAAWGRSPWLGAAAVVLAVGHMMNSWKTYTGAVRPTGQDRRD